MNRLTDYVLGRAVILWRVRHPDGSTIVCLVGQPRPGWCGLEVWRDGQVRIERRARCRIATALQWASEARAQVLAAIQEDR